MMMKIGGIKPKGIVGKPIGDSMLVPINLGQCRGMWLSSNLNFSQVVGQAAEF